MTFKQYFRLLTEDSGTSTKFNQLKQRVSATYKLVGDIFGDKIAWTTNSSDTGNTDVELVIREDEDNENVVYLENIYTNPRARNSGKATAMMQRFLAEVDKLEMDVYLEVDPYSSENGVSRGNKTPPLDVDQLRQWYKKFGFMFRRVPDSASDNTPEFSRLGYRPSKASKAQMDTAGLPPLKPGTQLDEENQFACISDLFEIHEFSTTVKFKEGEKYWVSEGPVYTLHNGKLQKHRNTMADWYGNVLAFEEY